MLTTTENKFQEYFDNNKNTITKKIKDNYSHYCNPNVNSKFLNGDMFFISGILYIVIATIFINLCETILFKIISGLIFLVFFIWTLYVINARYNLFKYRIFLIFVIPLIVESYVKGEKNYTPNDCFYKMCIEELTYYFQNAAYLWNKIEKE